MTRKLVWTLVRAHLAVSFFAGTLAFFPTDSFSSPLNIAGFEQLDLSDCRSTTGTTTFSSTNKRSGGGALLVNPAAGATLSNCRMSTYSTAGVNTSDFNVATLYTRFYLCTTTIPATEEQFVVFLDTGASDKGYFTINSSGLIKAYNNSGTLDATGTFAFSNTTCSVAANYHLVEITMATSATAAYSVKIDGVTDISDTMNTTTNNHGSVRFGRAVSLNANAFSFSYDDINFDNAALAGAGAILKMSPDGNGSSMTWTTVPSGSADQTQVLERPTDDDTTYVASTTSGAALFTFEDAATAGISGTINSVKLYTRFREQGDGSAATVVRIQNNAVNSDSAANNVGTTYVNRYRLLATDPNTGAAWTTGGLDTVQGGLNEGTALQINRFTTNMLQVDFAASAGTPTPTVTSTPTLTPTVTNTPTVTPTSTPTQRPSSLPLLGVGLEQSNSKAGLG